jgi:hypothetical protein
MGPETLPLKEMCTMSDPADTIDHFKNTVERLLEHECSLLRSIPNIRRDAVGVSRSLVNQLKEMRLATICAVRQICSFLEAAALVDGVIELSRKLPSWQSAWRKEHEALSHTTMSVTENAPDDPDLRRQWSQQDAIDRYESLVEPINPLLSRLNDVKIMLRMLNETQHIKVCRGPTDRTASGQDAELKAIGPMGITLDIVHFRTGQMTEQTTTVGPLLIREIEEGAKAQIELARERDINDVPLQARQKNQPQAWTTAGTALPAGKTPSEQCHSLQPDRVKALPMTGVASVEAGRCPREPVRQVVIVDEFTEHALAQLGLGADAGPNLRNLSRVIFEVMRLRNSMQVEQFILKVWGADGATESAMKQAIHRFNSEPEAPFRLSLEDRKILKIK